MKKQSNGPPPPIEQRPDPPPSPPPVRGVPLLSAVIEDLRLLEKMRQAAIDGEILKALLHSYARLKGLSEKELMDKIRDLKK